MKTTKDFKKFLSELMLGVFIVTTLNPVPALVNASSDKLIFPLKEISKLECRYTDFNNLQSNCKKKLPILNTKNYKKYSTQGGGYNEYTRTYTMLWGASYKYGWDVGHGGHIGTDIATSKGTPVYNIADGKVIRTKFDIMLGNFISIEHTIKGKKIVSNYAHLSKVNVKVGDRVNVGKKIGEVGSTGNSTGNHLHFQIDLDKVKHPYYYDYNKCPYSYYKITEQGVCFDELSNNTIDPLLFLETGGAILDNIEVRKTTTVKIDVPKKEKQTSKSKTKDYTIFDKTVYIGYDKSDIIEVQKIYNRLGVYNGKISGDYKDLEKSVVAYQLSKGIINDKYAHGSGWFGPQTRKITKIDYINYLEKGTKVKITVPTKTVVNNKTNSTKKKIITKKIERKNLLSRAEIEKREVEGFLKYHNVNLKLVNQGGNIKKGGTQILKLTVTTKRGKLFKGVMPGGMTFIVDKKKINVFPEKLFYFTDGQRDIILKGLSEGNTTLSVKIGNIVIKTIKLKVYASGKVIYPASSRIISPSNIILGQRKTGIAIFKDSKGKNLINLEYGSTYKLKASKNNKVCIKQGSMSNLKSIYKSKCSESDYKNEIQFSYNNTVGGVLIYDYIATNKDFKISITNNYTSKILSNKKLVVSNPKGLANNYIYKKEVVAMLEKGVVSGINQGYFLETRGLDQMEAFNWLENTLIKIKENTHNNSDMRKLNTKLANLKFSKKNASRGKYVTREDFLKLSYEYLIIDNTNKGEKTYRDLDGASSTKLASIFDESTSWKDNFGETYFRPSVKITRGEGAYFLSKLLERNTNIYLTLK